MENGHFILEILLLILVIALVFSYSEEVSSNRTLRAQIRRLPIVDKVKADILAMRVQHLEAEIVCKDEEIKRLTKSHQLTEDALYGSSMQYTLDKLRGRWIDEVGEVSPDILKAVSQRSIDLYRGEWIEEVNEQGDLNSVTHTLVGISGQKIPITPAKCADPDCSICHSELNATSPKPKRAYKKKLSDLETDENKTG